jgi:protein-tyrosine kinase
LLSLLFEDSIDLFLVDENMKYPQIHNIFGINPQKGMADYIAEKQSRLTPSLWRAENARLTVLPSGNSAGVSRQLFQGGAMSRFVQEISTRYSDRMIIMDSLPLLSSGEAAVLANHADHILLVVQAGRTSQSAVEDALDMLSGHDNVRHRHNVVL